MLTRFTIYSVFNCTTFQLNSNINFERLIFSDESRFSLDSDNQFRWYRKGESDPGCFHEQDKFSSSIMMFGAIGIDYKSKLVTCSSGVDAVEYRDIIAQSNIVNDLDAIYSPGEYIFVQDGAPAHTSYLTLLYLQKRLSVLRFWAICRPDLNPIEHIWGAMKRILKTRTISSKEQLLQNVYEIWNAFPQSSINRLVRSFECRLRAVLDINGDSISEILRSGINYTPSSVWNQIADPIPIDQLIIPFDDSIDDQPIEFLAKRPWTSEEVQTLLKLVHELGTKWVLIASRFEKRTAISCKNKYKSICK